jgi:hypothetical protein
MPLSSGHFGRAIFQKESSSSFKREPTIANAVKSDFGRVAERLMAAVLKTANGESRSWVQIPPLPPALVMREKRLPREIPPVAANGSFLLTLHYALRGGESGSKAR